MPVSRQSAGSDRQIVTRSQLVSVSWFEKSVGLGAIELAIRARDNPQWVGERIRADVLKLGLVASKRWIQRYRRAEPAHQPTQS